MNLGGSAVVFIFKTSFKIFFTRMMSNPFDSKTLICAKLCQENKTLVKTVQKLHSRPTKKTRSEYIQLSHLVELFETSVMCKPNTNFTVNSQKRVFLLKMGVSHLVEKMDFWGPLEKSEKTIKNLHFCFRFCKIFLDMYKSIKKFLNED